MVVLRGLATIDGLVDACKSSSMGQRAELIAEAIHRIGNICTSIFPHTIFNTEIHTDLKGHNKSNNQIMYIMHIMQFFTCSASRVVLKPVYQKRRRPDEKYSYDTLQGKHNQSRYVNILHATQCRLTC